MTAYYNEIDPFAAQWLRNLIAANHIAPGDIDERSILEVHHADIIGYTQCHFFAGVGVWSHALRLAGWPDDRPVWTGSCPCQPFSAAGKRAGTTDALHLWPEFYRLITAHQPVTVFGEQVASKDGLAWLDIVHADLEAAGYAVGAIDTCAAGFGAPHIRQRLYFIGENLCGERLFADYYADTDEGLFGKQATEHCVLGAAGESEFNTMAKSATQRRRGGSDGDSPEYDWEIHVAGRGSASDMGDANGERLQGRSLQSGKESGEQTTGERSVTNDFWSDADWLPCIDGKARAVEPGTFPLAHGAASRVGRLRAYGNAIVAPQAAEFIKAYMACRP